MSAEPKKRKASQAKNRQKSSKNLTKKRLSSHTSNLLTKKEQQPKVTLNFKVVNTYEDIGTNTDFFPLTELFMSRPRSQGRLKIPQEPSNLPKLSKHLKSVPHKLLTPNVKSLTPIMFFPTFKSSCFKPLSKHSLSPSKKSLKVAKSLLDYSSFKKPCIIRN